ncbi:MAG: 3',5'-cyclic adenosine monophosphate phosphodiesterase CpdA [Syntrophus sp. SKADARSKE-3]|nr:3',5'-cyclic adenosine monophosphate phosphodiesterase CpdA [Syntrophus sp. SKADARSKE-3]
MKLFLFLYFLIYGSIHAYAYMRFCAAFALPFPAKVVTILILAFMVLCPILIRVSENFGYTKTACILSYVGYLWMGIVFLFFASSLVLDIYRFVIFLGGKISPTPLSHFVPSSRLLFLLPLAVSLAVNLYGYFEALNIRAESITIRSAKIPSSVGRIRIVQISDVHVGMIIQGERLARMMAAAKAAKPDILVSTGDLVDGQIDSIDRSINILRDIPATYGKYAVTGNHEFYAGLDQALQFTQDAGFTVLRGEAAYVAGLVRLVGVDDPTARQMGRHVGIPEKDLLAPGMASALFTILLKHQPIIREESLGIFDLQLSGHTHRGQIFPFNLITGLFFPRQAGYYNLPKGSALYVSRGTGTWGPPVRFLSPPQITVIDLIHE